MTKKLLLAAAALGALAFAGAGQAADITAGSISGVTLIKPVDAKIVPFAIATEADLVAANMVSTRGTTGLTFGMDSPVAISANGSLPFAVTFTLSGPATFDDTVPFAYGDLLGGGVAPGSGVVVMSGDKKSVSFYVEFGGSSPVNVNSLTLNNVALKVTGQEDVSIAATASVTVAGHTQKVTGVDATPVVTFKSALKGFDADVTEATAMLDDFKEFGTGLIATGDTLGFSVATGLHKNMVAAEIVPGRKTLELGDIFSGATAKVTGPQVKALSATLGAAAATDVTSNSASFALTAAELNSAQLRLTQTNVPADQVVIEAGTYKAEIKPTFATGFTGNADKTLSLITVGLDGTNFYAPWFALNNVTNGQGANSTLRLANNGSSNIGPVVISLKARTAGSAASGGTHTIPLIEAGKFVSVTGATLKAAFGTDAANGDLMITVQSQADGLSAKVRTTQYPGGQIYENSLGANSADLMN